MNDIEKIEKQSVDIPGKEYIPDMVFETDNDLEIPTLRLDMQAQVCSIPFVLYGEQKRTFQMNNTGTLHFYTDDYRYGNIYEHPEKIIQHNPLNIVEPNFSNYQDTPIAFGMQQIYKKRFLARLCQERGIRVFVDLNVANKYYRLNLLGIPQGWSSFCTRGYSDRLQFLQFEHMLAKGIAGGNKLLFVVYGGGDIVRKYCQVNGLIYVNSLINLKSKAKANVMKLIGQNAAFAQQEFKLDGIIKAATDKLLKGQVEDYTKLLE